MNNLKMPLLHFALSILILLATGVVKISRPGENADYAETQRGDLRIMFYNCENLFDCEDDSTKNDNDFLPDSKLHWTQERYYKKLNNIAKVITAVGEWESPEIIGLCEIENRKVLEDLINRTGLKNENYRIIHKESPDQRGIDVAILYLPKYFKPISYEAIAVKFPGHPHKHTRDILYAKGVVKLNDTLHVYVNHWPSRLGGQDDSEWGRLVAASILRRHIDSVFATNPAAHIVIVGDFNDYPTDKSITDSLQAKTEYENPQNKTLYNIAYYLQENKKQGSHKFDKSWGILDQIIVSGSLLQKKQLYTTIDNASVFNAPFLLEEESKGAGTKPFRTYSGQKYLGGFSDHLPVYIDLFFNNK